jgi:hypothetical protein
MDKDGLDFITGEQEPQRHAQDWKRLLRKERSQ